MFEIAERTEEQVKADSLKRAVTSCFRCNAPIFFAQQNPTSTNPRPKNNPINAKPSSNGNLRVEFATMNYDVLSGQTLFEALTRGDELYESHMETCTGRGRSNR